MGNVNIINHPLVKHKITLMRDEKEQESSVYLWKRSQCSWAMRL